MVNVGIKSPIMGMNLIKLIAADLLFLVMEYNKLVVIPLKTSPITGISNRGAPM
jgi:hypothetical protein